MFKELLAKFRGTNDWVETTATVRIVLQYEDVDDVRFAGEENRKIADVTFAFTDAKQELQYGSVTVTESSALYDAKENHTFTIRFNPANPDEYESEDFR
jgi:hypothetical protein